MRTFEDDEINATLVRMFSAAAFKSSPKLQQFLRYIVAQKLDGKADHLKAYSIAIDVFNYPADFDPQNDPIIRVQARRLRTALKEYYIEAGAGEQIEITVPRGGYRPVFSVKSGFDDEVRLDIAALDIEGVVKPRYYILASLMVFLLLTGLGFGWSLWGGEDSTLANLGPDTITITMRQDALDNSEANVSEDVTYFLQNLRSSIIRNSAFSIILPARSALDEDEIKDETDFIIGTRVLRTGRIKNVSIELINGHTDKLVWSRSYKFSDIEDDMVFQIVRELNSEIFGASFQALEGRDPQTLTASQLFVLATWLPGPETSSLDWQKERIDLARLALKKDPEFGPAYSVLAHRLAYLAAVDGPSDTIEAADEAKTSAARALELSPADVNSLFNVALYYWNSGQLNNSNAMMNRVVELDPSHGLAHFFSIVTRYSCSVASDDVLSAAAGFDQNLGIDNPARWVTSSWLGWMHLNRGEYAAALASAKYAEQIYQNPLTIITHAAALNSLGRVEEAVELLKVQKMNWPNLDLGHFAKVSVPRFCTGQKKSEAIIDFYEKFDESISDYLVE